MQKYDFPKKGEPGYSPALENLHMPKIMPKFPTYKGKEVLPFHKTKEFKEPEDIQVLTKPELQVQLKEQKFAEIETQLNQVPQIVKDYINNYSGYSVKYLSNDTNSQHLINYSISTTYLSIAHQLYCSSYHRTDSLKDLSVLINFKPILPNQLNHLIYQFGDIHTRYGNIEIKWIRSTIEESILRSAAWLPSFKETTIPSIEDIVLELGPGTHGKFLIKQLKLLQSHSTGKEAPEKYLNEFDDEHCDTELLTFIESAKSLFTPDRLMTEKVNKQEYCWVSQEQRDKILTYLVPQMQKLEEEGKVKVVPHHIDTVKKMIEYHIREGTHMPFALLREELGLVVRVSHDIHQIEAFISNFDEIKQVFEYTANQVDCGSFTLYSENVEVSQDILENYVYSFSAFVSQKISPYFENWFKVSEFTPENQGSLSQLVQDKTTPFTLTNSDAELGYYMNIRKGEFKQSVYQGTSPLQPKKVQQLIVAQDLQKGEHR